MHSRSFRARLLLICTCAVLAACAGEKTPQQLLDAAKVALQKNDLQTATVDLKSALQKNPGSAEARYLLGRVLLDNDEFASAEKELRKALELKYSPELVHPLLARTLVAQGEFKDVVEKYGSNAPVGTGRANAEMHTALGEAYLGLGRLDEARDAFTKAVAADPTYARAIIGDARFLAQSSDLAAVLKRADAAIAAAPAYAEAWQFKGDILMAQTQFDAAAQAYSKAVELKRNYLPAHAGLVRALLEKGDQQAATKAVAQMKEVAPKSAQAYFLEALTLFQQKNYQGARAALEQELQLAPNEPRGSLLAAKIDYELKAYPQAEERLLEILRRSPGQYYARLLLVELYVRTGKPTKALDALKPVLASGLEDVRILNLAGTVYLQNNDPAKAAAYFAKAIPLDPKNAAQRTGLALARVAQGDSDRGIRELEALTPEDEGVNADLALIAAAVHERKFDKALAAIDVLEKKQPDKPDSQNLRGLVLVQMRDAPGARKSFEGALAKDPKFLPAVINLAKLDLAKNDSAAATQRFETLIARDPKNVPAILALAELRASQNASSEEITAVLAKAIAAAPSDPSPRLALIAHYLAAGEPKKAVAAGEEALTAIPRQSDLVDALGQAQRAAGDLNQAVATYNGLAAITPDSPYPLLKIAEIQTSQRKYDDAARSLRRALEMQPDLVAAQRGLIAISVMNDRMPEAVAMAHDMQRRHPKEALGYIVEGDVYSSQKLWKEAIAAYRNAVMQTGSSEAAIRMHMALVASGQAGEADKAAASWLNEHPTDAGYRSYIADAATRRGDYAGAMQQYRVLLQQQPDSALVLNNAAWVAGRLDDPHALEYAERANDLAPNQPDVMDTLGTLLVERGDAARGVQLLARAAALKPAAADIRLRLATGLMKIGEKERARRELDELAKLGSQYARQGEVAKLRSSL